MRKTRSWVTLLLAGAVAVAPAWSSQAQPPQAPAPSALAQKLRHELILLPYYGLFVGRRRGSNSRKARLPDSRLLDTDSRPRRRKSRAWDLGARK